MANFTNIKSVVDIQRLPVNSEEHKFNDWTIKYKKSHILHSQCSTPQVCADLQKERCQFCLYYQTLSLPHLPDMVFPNNILTLSHVSGGQIEFSALEALKTVSTICFPFKVACAQIWREARAETNLEEKGQPFDWTFSTSYKGTLSESMTITETEERINLEKLKVKEKILFFHEMTLFEDELHDNGIASCNVKIRVMPTSYFILLRYFLRVDNVMVRVNDTRIFHEFGTDYLLREYTNREGCVQDLNLPLPMYADANTISPHLPIKTATYEKITWT